MSDLSEPRAFYAFFREQFSYLEADDREDYGRNVMMAFYEHTYSKGTPWLRVCGFWNVFVKLDFSWDVYDHLFSFNVRLSPETNIYAPTAPREQHFLSDILSVFDRDWVAPWKTMDISEGPEMVRIYAAAVKPFAKEIFLPTTPGAKEFDGFKWHLAARAIREKRKQQP